MLNACPGWLRVACACGLACVMGLAVAAELPPARPPLPPAVRPPLPKSPVDQFRELLSATPEQREEILAQKKPEARELIRANLKQFDAVSPNERELLLRVLQVHQHLIPLLQAPVEERAGLLAAAPVEDRRVLEDRLKAWDGLPAEARQVLLADKRSLNYFIQLERVPAADRGQFIGRLPEPVRQAFESQFQRWSALPEDVRSKTTSEFQKFFELTPDEREKTLRRLSDVERRQMAETLKLFADLPPEQRARCLTAFRRFSGMSESERADFLRNAARWRDLDPDERAGWRRLVNSISKPPPLPPIPMGRHEMVAGTNLPPNRSTQ